MKRAIKASELAVRDTVARQGGLITRSQALAAGMTSGALRHKIGAGARWQVVLPGVYREGAGYLTAGQREIAAVLFVGHGAVITGSSALARQGIWAPPLEVVDVLIPHQFRRRSTGFVRVHRTIRMPTAPVLIDGLLWAPPARAIADAVRADYAQRDVRELVANAVQRQACTVPQLAAELSHGAAQGSEGLRQALEEVADGIASVAEGDLRAIIKRSGLPEPMYNPRLFVGEEFLAKPDAWWPDAGVAGEVDSREYHLSPDSWARTLARHAAMSAHGIIVVHYTPRRLRTEPDAVAMQLRSTLEAGRQRPLLPIRAVPT
jgi:hypothetical protein